MAETAVAAGVAGVAAALADYRRKEHPTHIYLQCQFFFLQLNGDGYRQQYLKKTIQGLVTVAVDSSPPCPRHFL
jgi:hypothetical protein